MASYAAALLDELMGRNRDSNPHDISIKKDHWSDEKICKYFLCGFCPHDLFINTKADLGKCSKLHEEEFRISYQTSDRVGKMGYEKDFERFLVSLANDVDRRIRRGEQRLVLNNQNKATFMTPSASVRQQRIDELTESINNLVAEAERLGCKGNVDEAQELMSRCEKMKMEKNSLSVVQTREQQATDQEMNKVMEVCGICGAFLVVGDPQQRQDEHIMGKLHMGYAKIKAYLKERNVKLASEMMKMDGQGSGTNSYYKPSPYTSIDLASDLNLDHESSRSRSRSRKRKRSHSSEKKHRSHSKSHKSSKEHKHHRRHKHHHHHRSHRDNTPDN